jgi:exopolyphosphatase / guanosine-5'-triphosphate,3'-diphosphate pyrophosphatase
MKIAAIDIGSNSIHMVIAEVRDGHFEILDRAKEMVGLARGTLSSGRFSDETLEAGFQTLSTFKRLAEKQGADPILAVATSAVREAENGGDLALRAWEELGLQIDVITGTEEARLIFLAAQYSIDFRNERPLVVDIGGGSVEVIFGHESQIRWQESLKLGVVRLTERFLKADPPKKREIAALDAFVRRSLEELFARTEREKPTMMIGTSGTLLNLVAMAHAARDGKVPETIHNRTITPRDVERLRKTILECDAEKRARIPGLDRKRADLAPAGVILAQQLLEGFAVPELRACEWALREGILLDFIARHRADVEAADRVPDIRRRSVLRLAERFQSDGAHGEKVSELALTLFDRTKGLHRLGTEDRELLDYAARLHDIGLSISHSKHHRHSHYLITNGELRGFTPEEVQAIAAIARYHKGAPPKSGKDDLAELPEKLQDRVIPLAAILRVADSLDRTHHGIVRGLRVSRRNGRLEIRVDTGGRDAELEIWGARRKGELWERWFDVGLDFRVIERRGRRAAKPQRSTPAQRKARSSLDKRVGSSG